MVHHYIAQKLIIFIKISNFDHWINFYKENFDSNSLVVRNLTISVRFFFKFIKPS